MLSADEVGMSLLAYSDLLSLADAQLHKKLS